MKEFSFPEYGTIEKKERQYTLSSDLPKAHIRIQNIEIENLKAVKHGKVEMFPVNKAGDLLGESNILALYGQNGSGKTTIVEAIYLLKTIITGGELPHNMHDYISVDAETASIKTVFAKWIPGLEEVEYITYFVGFAKDDSGVRLSHEMMSVNSRDLTGKLTKKTRKLFDTQSHDKVLNTSVVKVRIASPDKNDVREESYPKGTIFGDYDDHTGASAIFWEDLTNLSIVNFGEEPNDEWFIISPNRYDYSAAISDFMQSSLFVAGANLFEDTGLPICTRKGYLRLDDNGILITQTQKIAMLEHSIAAINKALSAIIPGLTLAMAYSMTRERINEINEERIINTQTENGFQIQIDEDVDNEVLVIFYTERNGKTIPFTNESEGIKKIVYSVDLFVNAFNDPGFTAVIDEYDAGVFEYLLGELLQLFESHGKGQLIFTSHNLRPLELIDKSFVCFTTTNPSNRYIRLKYIGTTNNLRDVYFRQLLIGEQDEELYRKTKPYMLLEALEPVEDYHPGFVELL